eukprot:5850100-Pyramimonas_sp.AAC.1
MDESIEGNSVEAMGSLPGLSAFNDLRLLNPVSPPATASLGNGAMSPAGAECGFSRLMIYSSKRCVPKKH